MLSKERRGKTGRYVRAACAVLAGSLVAQAVGAGQRGRSDATWIGPLDGLWSVADNWSGGVVPNGADWNVFIDSDGGVDSCAHVNGSYTVGGLTIDAGDKLRIDNNVRLYLADGTVVTNNGELHLDSAGNYTYLWLSGAGASLAGDGSVVLGDGSVYNYLYAGDWHYRLTNTGNHTIRGGGSVGGNNMILTNEALIQGDSTARYLYVELGGDADYESFNTGTMQGADGGTLSIWGSSINNAGGLIRALDGSAVELGNGSHIYNGTLDTEGTGLIFTRSGQASLISDLTNEGAIEVTNNSRLYFRNSLVNNGTIAVNSEGNWTYFWLDQPTATLSGSGEVILADDHYYNHVYASDWHYRLTNTGDHTIRGAGSIGGNNMLLTNEALIQGDSTEQYLYVELGGDADNENFNTGIMQGANGGTLSIWGSTIDNTNGVIRALDGSAVEFGDSSYVHQGTLSTEGTGTIFTREGQVGWIADLTTSGAITVKDNGRLYCRGTITNDGTISLDSQGNYTYLWTDVSETALTGSGEVVLNGNQYNRIYASDWRYRMTNTGGHTFRGGGSLGANNMLFTNEALVQADNPNDGLTVDLAGGDADNQNYNSGTMQAVDGATLWIWGSTINNEGGVFQAQEGSTVAFGNSSHIYNGAISSQGSGLLQVWPGQLALFENLTNAGTLSVANNSQMRINGTITNDGTITLDSEGNYSYLWLNQSEGTLAGSGEVVIGDNPNNRIYASDWQWVLTNGPDHTIRGGGSIGANNIGLINQGSIVADAPGGMVIDVADSAFDNQGLVHVTGDGYLNITHGPLDHHGTVVIDETRTLHRDGNFTQTGGFTTVEGTLEMASGVVDLQGGVLQGNGLVKGSVSNTGTVSPGLSIGELFIEGDYTHPRLGVLHIEVAGTAPGEYDMLTIDGGASVNGTIVIEPVDDYEPMIGDEFTILTATGTLSGNGVCRPPYMFTYTDHSIIATVIDAPEPADLNCDGMVNIDDLFMVLAAWGPCPAPPHGCREDIDQNGQVDIDDLFAVLANWT